MTTMKAKILNFSVIIITLSVLMLSVPVEAKSVKTAKAKKITIVSKTKKTSTESSKKSKLSIKKNTKKTAVSVFSATEASRSTSYSGKLPPAGYMEALKKAEDNLLAAKVRAHGNKAKNDAAVVEYDQALSEAQQMLN